MTYATWRQRAEAALIDSLVLLPGLVALAVSVLIGMILLVVALAFSAWQASYLQGLTGQTVGKRAVGIFLVGRSDLAPIGPPRTGWRGLAPGRDTVVVAR